MIVVYSVRSLDVSFQTSIRTGSELRTVFCTKWQGWANPTIAYTWDMMLYALYNYRS